MNESSRPTIESGPVTLAFALAGAALLVRVLCTGVPDAGDGVGHYLIARYAWKHPHLLLDAWGKPLFTLLASPFAHLGMWGIALFNALCGAVAALVVLRYIAGVHRAWCWAVPLLLFAAPQFSHTLMAGLTEPLFAVLAVLAVVLALHGRWSWALGVASFLPYTRPEHVAVLPPLLLLAVWYRQWRALPWVLLGTVFYMVFSFVVLGDPLKVLLNDPYKGVDTYGTGPALHFVNRMNDVIGTPLIAVSLLAMLAWPLLWWKEREGRGRHVHVLVLALGPALGILVIHSYAWWRGGHGSLGLERVLATGVPLLVLFSVHVLASAWQYVPWRRAKEILCAGALLVFSGFAYPELVQRLLLPYRPNNVQTTLESAAAKVNEVRKAGERIHYLSPYIGVLCNVDPMDTAQAYQTYGVAALIGPSAVRKGDLVVWDAQHSRVDGNIPLDTLMRDEGYRLLASLKPREETIVFGGVPYEVHVFQRAPAQRALVCDTLYAIGRSQTHLRIDHLDTIAIENGSMTIADSEFPMTFTELPLASDRQAVQERLLVRGSVAGSFGKDQLDLVLVEMDGAKDVRYVSIPLVGGSFSAVWDVGLGSAALLNKLYIWNRSGKSIRLERFEILRERLVQRLPVDQ